MTGSPFREIPPPKPPKTNYLLIIVPLAVFGVVMLLGAFGVGVFFVLQRNGAFAPPPPPRPAESLAEKQRANAEAFGKAPVKSDASADEVKALLLLLERTARISTPAQVEACFDIDRMYQEVKSQSTNPRFFDSRDAQEAFRKSLPERLAAAPILKEFPSVAIKRVKLLDPDEAIVFSQHRSDSGTGMKMRWWGRRVAGKWRWYDFEDVQVGLRSTSNVAVAIDSLSKSAADPRQSQALQNVTAATGLLAQARFEEAGPTIRQTFDVSLPASFDALRHGQLALVELAAGNAEQALALVDRGLALKADLPMLPMLRAQALNALGRYEEAAVDAQKYLENLGSDAHGSWLLGTALAGMEKKEEAADAFRQGLADDRTSVNNLVGLASVLPDDSLEEIGDRFAAFERPAAHFAEVASQLIENENAAALAVIVARNRELAPRDPHNDYYQGELHWMRQEYEKAAEAFSEALARLPDDERGGCQKAIRNSLLYAGKPVEAYQAMPDGDDTFLSICNRLVKQRDADGLDKLAALHAERKPDDSWLPYFRGEALVLRERYEEAAAAFRPMLDAQLSDNARSSYHDEYLAAEINAGHALEAYRAVPDATDAFLDAANRLMRENNVEDLEKLVALHAERQPGDLLLPYFRGEVLYLRGKNAEAAAVFEPQLTKEMPDNYRRSYVREYLRCMTDAGKLIEAYRAVPDAAFAFKTLADELVDRWDGADRLEELVAAHTERLPEDPWLPYYRGRLLIMRFRYRDAAELLAPLIQMAEDDELKADLAEACRAALLYDGRPQEAYAVSIHRETGFERTASYLANKLDADGLERLVATREAEQHDDPALTYFKARLADINDDCRAVVDLLRPALETVGEGQLRQQMVSVLLSASQDLGVPLEAYHAVSAEEGFNALAWGLANAGDADQLEQLLAAHEARKPDDAQLPYFRGRVAQFRGHDAEAADLFTKWFKTIGDEDEDEETLEMYLEAMASARHPLEAYANVPDASAAFYRLASEVARRDEADLLDALIDAHAKQHADDPWLDYLRGRALLLRGNETKALAAYESVVRAAADAEEEPQMATWALQEFLLIGEPLEAYAVMSQAKAARWTFRYLADDLLSERDFLRLEQLVAAHKQSQADDPVLLRFAAECLLAKRQFNEAIQILEPHLSDEDESGGARLRSVYERAMLKAGRSLELYQAAADKRETFRQLVSSLYEAGDAEGLQAILAEHRAADGQDPWLGFYRAQQLRLARKYAEADQAFAALLDDRDTQSIRGTIIEARIETRFEAGQALSAYEEIGPRRATLNALLELCRSKRDARQFEQLLAAQRQRFPNDASLPQWDLEILDLKGDDGELLKAVDDLSAPSTRYGKWVAFGLKIRALLRSQRFDDARAAVAAHERSSPVPFYRAMVEAAAGNVSAATSAVYDYLRLSYGGVQELYEDRTLGQALRSDAFSEFRERHSESPLDVVNGHGTRSEGTVACRTWRKAESTHAATGADRHLRAVYVCLPFRVGGIDVC